MRFRYFLYCQSELVTVLLFARVFTSFYAGINTIFEKDLKKLIALSTLSHLGFIGIAFSSGLLFLAFFHLLTHALFKSLLFITIGDVIINLNHSQDIRYLSKGSLITPFSSNIIIISVFNLLGLPTLRGYFSKDLVLEVLNYSSFSFVFQFFVFLNVFFTYYYSYQLLFFSFQTSKFNPFQLFHSSFVLHASLILCLGLISVVFGSFFIRYVISRLLFLVTPRSVKFIPLFLNISYFILIILMLKLFTSSNIFFNSYFSRIIFLAPLMLSISSFSYLKLSSQLFKTFETGVLNSFFNKTPSTILFFTTKVFLNQSHANPLNII
jgi:NADH:ubiquinone oxidoreductase subunit 5 (subunit L)/multisubunit Na+/H+ antiporter MnhA subunit